MSEKITAYKGMDANMQCRGFQFEVGGEYETDSALACKQGFHACEYPLDVLGYYASAGNRFFAVEQSGDISRDGDDSKAASTKIKINAEIGIPGLVKAAIEYTTSRAKPVKGGCATGFQGAASATGDQGAASAAGDQGAASATGFQGAASATGDQGAASATGFQGAASATGDQGAASATGDQGAASATGFQGAASATGNRGAASATGFQGAASATGKGGIAVASGCGGKAMGALGCAICVCERGKWDGNIYPLIGVKAAIVDGKTIKADTWYKLVNGEFVEDGK